MGGLCRRHLDGQALTIDELVAIVGTLGRVWRAHRRRRWPDGLKDVYASTLLDFRSAVAPKLDAGCIDCISASPSDIRGLAKFLARVARRSSFTTAPRARQVTFDLAPAVYHFTAEEPLQKPVREQAPLLVDTVVEVEPPGDWQSQGLASIRTMIELMHSNLGQQTDKNGDQIMKVMNAITQLQEDWCEHKQETNNELEQLWAALASKGAT